MAYQFLTGQVAVSDPSPVGPTPLSGPPKDLQLKLVRLTSANFSTTGTNALVAMLPADASIIGFRVWTKTALTGNSVSAPTMGLGLTSGGTDFTSAVAITNTSGTYAVTTPVSNIAQAYNIPYGQDIPIWFRGGCSTGNPTAGELFLVIEYVR